MEYVDQLCILLFAHFFADYSLQTQFLSQTKNQSYYVCFVHSFIYTGAVAFAMRIMELVPTFVNVYMIGLLITHFIVDSISSRWIYNLQYGVQGSDIDKKVKWVFYGDQAIHLITLGIIWILIKYFPLLSFY